LDRQKNHRAPELVDFRGDTVEGIRVKAAAVSDPPRAAEKPFDDAIGL
jgi:hypothetical protein